MPNSNFKNFVSKEDGISNHVFMTDVYFCNKDNIFVKQKRKRKT